MTDTMLTVPDSSQPQSSSSVADDVFTFLVHSQSSVTNGEPPEVDNGRLARQKRRRTSPEDQATLEAEYLRNPKPDKVARLEIVKKVSLGEKEVQIWFQNRRQNTRRKSRPLLPHEIAAFGLGGIGEAPSAPTLDSTYNVSESIQSKAETPSSSQDTDSTSKGDTISPVREASKSPQSERALVQSAENDPYKKAGNEYPPSKHAGDLRSHLTMSTKSLISQHRHEQPSHTVGYLSNRRNAQMSFTNAEARSQPSDLKTPTNPVPLAEKTPPLKVRLSLSLEGKAEVISTDLSPPRPINSKTSSPGTSIRTRPQRVMRRSQSALPFSPMQKSTANAPFVPRMPTGRSRDTRTWEFCCNPDARDELTKQAENESSGSAVAAINLLRSTNTAVLKPNTGKRNILALTSETNRPSKRPKLGRSSSSCAAVKSTAKSPEESFGDSDKENWIPRGESGNPRRRRPLPTTRPQKGTNRRILGEQRRAPKKTLDSAPQIKSITTSIAAEIPENNRGNVEMGQQVENLLKGEISPSKRGDLDCIQGLLSLSQGKWNRTSLMHEKNVLDNK